MSASPIKVTILVDDRALPGLQTEHGFSLWIETRDGNVLFDTGQSDAVVANAATLGVDLSRTDFLVFSHGHYDHTGGVPAVLDIAPQCKVYCHPGVIAERYSVRDGTAKRIGAPTDALEKLQELPKRRLHWVRDAVSLTGDIGLTGPIPRETPYEDVGGPFYFDESARRPDPIVDDLALWLRTDAGVVLCVGCCHAGLVNAMTRVQRLSNETPQVALGGLHLLNADATRMEKTIAATKALGVKKIVPCHCSGDNAVAALIDGLGENVVTPGMAGMSYRF